MQSVISLFKHVGFDGGLKISINDSMSFSLVAGLRSV